MISSCSHSEAGLRRMLSGHIHFYDVHETNWHGPQFHVRLFLTRPITLPQLLRAKLSRRSESLIRHRSFGINTREPGKIPRT